MKNPELRSEIQGLRGSEWHRIIGGDGRGAVIVSQLVEPVDFADYLSCRVVILVPIDDLDQALEHIGAHTQTIGVFPASVKRQLRDQIALRGGQRIVTLGHQNDANSATPQDAIEPVRRMVRWVIDETFENDAPSWFSRGPEEDSDGISQAGQ